MFPDLDCPCRHLTCAAEVLGPKATCTEGSNDGRVIALPHELEPPLRARRLPVQSIPSPQPVQVTQHAGLSPLLAMTVWVSHGGEERNITSSGLSCLSRHRHRNVCSGDLPCCQQKRRWCYRGKEVYGDIPRMGKQEKLDLTNRL